MIRLEVAQVTRTALLETMLTEQDLVLDVVQSALLDDELNLCADRGPVPPMDHAEQVVVPIG